MNITTVMEAEEAMNKTFDRDVYIKDFLQLRNSQDIFGYCSIIQRKKVANIFLFKHLLRFSRLYNEKDPGRVKRNGTEGVTTNHGLLHEPTNWK